MKYVFLIVFLKMTIAETPEHIDTWVVWNIGQGQWVTHITSTQCRHFDAGGEIGSFKRIKRLLLNVCGSKKNELLLSHWDSDHFFNIPSLARAVPSLCWRHHTHFGEKKAQAQKILSLKISECAVSEELPMWQPATARTTNESSAVFAEQNVLLPGDSPITQEKLWAHQLAEVDSAKVLILGHHGSRTSTGRELLAQLPRLSFSVSSARYERYRHPHPDTVKRLQEFKIPLLKTEDWGNIWFTP